MRCFVFATVALTLGLGSPAAGQAVSRDQARELKLRANLAPYLDVVHQYRRGQFAEAADRLLAMETSRVDAAIEAIEALAGRVEPKLRSPEFKFDPEPEADAVFVGHLASPPRSIADIDLADVEAAVLLHTDTSFRAWSLERSSGVTFHAGAAARLARWLHETLGLVKTSYPKIDPALPRLNLREWCLSAAKVMTGLLENEVALALLKASLEWFPLDAELWLASGTSREGIARLVEVWDPGPPGRAMRQRIDKEGYKTLDQIREDAVRDYRRALGLDPGLLEARLRLGRVLAKNDRSIEAEREFRAVLASAADDYLRYLASLYLGRVLELRRQVAPAVELYRAAVKLQPDCQACRFALAHALDSLGEARQARVELMTLLSVQSPKPDRADGWWIYPYGRVGDAEGAWEELRKLVRYP